MTREITTIDKFDYRLTEYYDMSRQDRLQYGKPILWHGGYLIDVNFVVGFTSNNPSTVNFTVISTDTHKYDRTVSIGSLVYVPIGNYDWYGIVTSIDYIREGDTETWNFRCEGIQSMLSRVLVFLDSSGYNKIPSQWRWSVIDVYQRAKRIGLDKEGYHLWLNSKGCPFPTFYRALTISENVDLRLLNKNVQIRFFAPSNGLDITSPDLDFWLRMESGTLEEVLNGYLQQMGYVYYVDFQPQHARVLDEDGNLMFGTGLTCPNFYLDIYLIYRKTDKVVTRPIIDSFLNYDNTTYEVNQYNNVTKVLWGWEARQDPDRAVIIGGNVEYVTEVSVFDVKESAKNKTLPNDFALFYKTNQAVPFYGWIPNDTEIKVGQEYVCTVKVLSDDHSTYQTKRFAMQPLIYGDPHKKVAFIIPFTAWDKNDKQYKDLPLFFLNNFDPGDFYYEMTILLNPAPGCEVNKDIWGVWAIWDYIHEKMDHVAHVIYYDKDTNKQLEDIVKQNASLRKAIDKFIKYWRETGEARKIRQGLLIPKYSSSVKETTTLEVVIPDTFYQRLYFIASQFEHVSQQLLSPQYIVPDVTKSTKEYGEDYNGELVNEAWPWDSWLFAQSDGNHIHYSTDDFLIWTFVNPSNNKLRSFAIYHIEKSILKLYPTNMPYCDIISEKLSIRQKRRLKHDKNKVKAGSSININDTFDVLVRQQGAEDKHSSRNNIARKYMTASIITVSDGYRYPISKSTNKVIEDINETELYTYAYKVPSSLVLCYRIRDKFYGPYSNNPTYDNEYNTQIIRDDSLVPWNFGTLDRMEDRIYNMLVQNQLVHRSIPRVEITCYDYFRQIRHAYGWVKPGCPVYDACDTVLSNISTSFGDNGWTTTLSFYSYLKPMDTVAKPNLMNLRNQLSAMVEYAKRQTVSERYVKKDEIKFRIGPSHIYLHGYHFDDSEKARKKRDHRYSKRHRKKVKIVIGK